MAAVFRHKNPVNPSGLGHNHRVVPAVMYIIYRVFTKIKAHQRIFYDPVMWNVPFSFWYSPLRMLISKSKPSSLKVLTSSYGICS